MALSKTLTLSDPFNFHTFCVEIAKEANASCAVKAVQVSVSIYLPLYLCMSVYLYCKPIKTIEISLVDLCFSAAGFSSLMCIYSLLALCVYWLDVWFLYPGFVVKPVTSSLASI